jgi:hypothetical protein
VCPSGELFESCEPATHQSHAATVTH